jgi:hypothetical protein
MKSRLVIAASQTIATLLAPPISCKANVHRQLPSLNNDHLGLNGRPYRGDFWSKVSIEVSPDTVRCLSTEGGQSKLTYGAATHKNQSPLQASWLTLPGGFLETCENHPREIFVIIYLFFGT